MTKFKSEFLKMTKKEKIQETMDAVRKNGGDLARVKRGKIKKRNNNKYRENQI